MLAIVARDSRFEADFSIVWGNSEAKGVAKDGGSCVASGGAEAF